MGKLNVKNGTPVGSEHLCKSCNHGQFTTGYRESDILVVCTNVYPSIKLPFVVHECSDFEDKLRPDWKQMEKLAIQIQPVRVSKKTRGFNVAGTLRPETPEFDPAIEEDEELEDVDVDVDAVAELALTP
jgi:hypothetical protein